MCHLQVYSGRMKVFRVEVQKEMYVLAEDRDAAEMLAIENANDELSEWAAFGAEVKDPKHVPADELGCLIWHEGSEDITIAEALGGKRP